MTLGAIIGDIVGSIVEARCGIPDDIRKKALDYLSEEMKNVIDKFGNIN